MLKAKSLLVFLLIVCFALPVFILGMLSVSVQWVFPYILPAKLTAAHWLAFLSDSSTLQKSFFTSLFLSVTVSTFATLTGFVTARWIAFHKRKQLLLTVAYLPFALSPVIFAVCLKYYFLKAGLAGNIAGVLLAQLIITFPYSVIFFASFWNDNVRRYEHVSSTLGSGNLTTFKKIILPLAKQFLITCFFQCFILSWFEYGLTTVIGYGKVETLTIQVYRFIGESNIYYAALSSCLLVLPPVILLWINKKFILQQSR